MAVLKLVDIIDNIHRYEYHFDLEISTVVWNSQRYSPMCNPVNWYEIIIERSDDYRAS